MRIEALYGRVMPADTTASAPTAPAARSPWTLTDAQVDLFDQQGFLVLEQRIPAPMLERLQDAASGWTAQGSDPRRQRPEDWLFAARPSGQVMYRVDYLHDKGHPASLELLGSPQVLGIAESLAGPDFVPTYESLVFKSAGDGAPVPWHQDAVHDRRHRIFNVGVYLDASTRGHGALRVVPGSQRRRVDTCALADRHGWDMPGAVEVEMRPGDVLVHDDMIIHGSPPAVANDLRRTVYLEFRSARCIAEDGPWSQEWALNRMRLLPLALAEHARWAAPGDRYAWQASADLRPEPSADRDVELRIVHEVHTPGVWCSPGPA